MGKRAALLGALALVSGCASTVAGTAQPVRLTDGDRELVRGYYERLNTAGGEGMSQQQRLLRETQHPDFRQSACDLAGGTLRIEPTMSTLRPDADWIPPAGKVHPRGVVYVVAVTVTFRQDRAVIGSQVGSQHVVLLDGRAYGFAPCVGG